VRAPGPGFRALIFACLAALASSLPAAGAEPADRLRAEADELRQANQSLTGQVASTESELESLDTELASTRARLAQLRAQGVRLARKQGEARTALNVARAGLRVSQRRLADRVRALYEQGKPEPLAVILGAQTLDGAVSGVEHLTRIADDDRQNIQRARAARQKLIALTAILAQREAENESLRAAAADAASTLLRARAQRISRIASLAAMRDSNGRRIASLESTARALASVASTPAAAGSRLLTVVATGYTLPGNTASGIPVGPGVVAVDPAVIPLGTRLTIPGYGQGIAADTGGAIRGARIDLWFSSHAEALAWGRRTVTIAVGG
jgi:3D (Asp-Asp-Asp) domain-containing protein